ncbi:hypothetical protein N9L76_03225 [bacterium]|nr:hypothetical protein [bacterium]
MSLKSLVNTVPCTSDVQALCIACNGEERTARRVQGVALERLPVGQVDVFGCGDGRAPRGTAIGARERMPVERRYLLFGGIRRVPRDSSVGARERLPMELADVQ